MIGRLLVACGVAAALLTSSAQAAVIQERGPLLSGTNGIALGPDGNFWVSEQFNDSVVRMKPDGTVVQRFDNVGDGPTTVATGPGNRVWVAVTGANKLAWFDATSASPSRHDVAMPVACGPVGLVDGGDSRMYFSIPDCGAGARVGTVAGDGTGTVTALTNRGQAYDIEAVGGKLYVPDAGGDAVRRMSLGTALTVETSLGASGTPDGIAADGGGNLWVTLNSSGRVGRFTANQNLGTVTELTPTGGTLSSPFGIVAGNDGRIYVTGKDSKNLARINADGSFRFYATGGEPFQIVNGPDGDLFFTDQSATRILRFLSAPPRAATGVASAVASNAASATAIVDPRGNATQVVFDYGTTTAYGATSAPVTLPEGAGGVPVTVVLGGLTPSSTYHVRVRALNEEGTVAGADTTVMTLAGDADGDGVAPPLDCNDANAAIRPGAVDKPGDKIDQDCSGADAKFPLLKARSNFSWAFTGSRTLLTKVDVTGLVGGETIKVTCKGTGCSFKTKTYKKVKKGKKSLTSLFGRKRKLSTGAKIEVRVTRASNVGSSAVATIGKRKKDPKIVRRCLQPGASKTSRCS